MTETIEQKTSATLLQAPEEVIVGDRHFTITPPSVATLILASAAVSRLPHIRLDEAHIVEESLSVAKDCEVLGEIAAILILGAKQVNEPISTRSTITRSRLWGLITTRREVTKTETKLARLSRELLEDLTPRDLHNLVARILQKMQIGDFFGLTTFLTEINLIRPTKVETEATASGR